MWTREVDLAEPVAGPPSVVRDREYLEAIGELLEHNVIRKPNDRRSPCAPGDERNPLTGRRKPLEVFESFEDFGDEAVRNRWITRAIPGRRFAEFLPGAGLDNDAFQR